MLDNAPNSVYNDIVDDADGGNDMDGFIYGYYLTRRPPEPDAHPDNELCVIRYHEAIWQEAVGEHVYGWVGYAEPLTQELLDEFFMTPDEDNPVRYRHYGVLRRETKTDADGKRTVISGLVPDGAGKPMRTPHKGKAMVLMFELQKAARCAGITTVEYSMVVVVQKDEQ